MVSEHDIPLAGIFLILSPPPFDSSQTSFNLPNNFIFHLGYLLVADFGLAKFVKQGELANSFCGTAEYLAPEMLIGNGHDFTVDWWALGILIFEMIVGIPPFFNRNKHRMYFLIRESPVNFPDPKRHKISVSPEA